MWVLIFYCLLSLIRVSSFVRMDIIVIWVLLEVRTVLFVPLYILSRPSSVLDSSLMFSLTQVLRATLIIVSVLLSWEALWLLSLCLKSGLWPFHGWWISIIPYLNPLPFVYASTVVKGPLLRIVLLNPLSTWLVLVVIISYTVSGVGGMGTSYVKTLLAWRRLNHLRRLIILGCAGAAIILSVKWFSLQLFRKNSVRLVFGVRRVLLGCVILKGDRDSCLKRLLGQVVTGPKNQLRQINVYLFIRAQKALLVRSLPNLGSSA